MMLLANQTNALFIRFPKSVMIHHACTVQEQMEWTTYIKSIRDCPPHAGKIKKTNNYKITWEFRLTDYLPLPQVAILP